MLTVIQDAGPRLQEGALMVAGGAALLLAFKDWFLRWSLSPPPDGQRRARRRRSRGPDDGHASPPGAKPVF